MSEKRTETLVIEVEGKTLPQWILDAHLKPEGANGVRVKSMASGNTATKLDKLVEVLNFNFDKLPGEVQQYMEDNVL